MAKTGGTRLTLEDLIQAQQKMAEKGDTRAAEQVKRLTAIAEEEKARAAAAKQQESFDKLTATLEKKLKQDAVPPKVLVEIQQSLVEESGKGLNANLIKLFEEFKKANTKQGVSGNQEAPAKTKPERDEKRAAELLEQRSKEQARRYIPTIADKIGWKTPATKSVLGYARAVGQMAKGAVSLENIFDVEKIRAQGGKGLLGGTVLRKAEENEYVRDRLIVEKNRMLNLPQYQGEKGRKLAEKKFRTTFRQAQTTQGEIAANEKAIADLRARGTSERDIQQAGLIKTRETLDVRLTEQEAIYRGARRADEASVTREASAEASKPSRKKKPTVVPEQQATEAAAAVKKTRAGLIGKKKTQPAAEIAGVAVTPAVELQTPTTAAEASKPSRKKNPTVVPQQQAADAVTALAAPASEPSIQKTPVVVPDQPTAPVGVVPVSAAAAEASKPSSKKNPTVIPEQQATSALGPAIALATPAPSVAAQPITAAGKEAQSENARLMNEQTALLKQIADNTAKQAQPVKPNAPASDQPPSEGGGLLDDIIDIDLPLRRGPRAPKTAPKVPSKGAGVLSKLGGVARTVGKVAVPLAAAGSVYSGVTDIAEGKSVETVSDIVPEGWGKINPFSWAFKGGAYLGGKINKGVEAVTGGQSLGGKIYDWLNPSEAMPITKAPVTPAIQPPQQIKPDTKVAAPAPQGADQVYNKSGENAAAIQKPVAAAPVVINAPTMTTTNQTQNYAPKSPPRNTESSYQQYLRARFAG